MAWYRLGTVTVTNNSPTVVGFGTAWNANVKAGHGFIGPDKATYEILSVNSDTSITLAENYGGSTASAQAYKIIPTQGLVQSLTTQVQGLIADYSGVLTGAGAGRFADGAAALPGVTFAADLDTGLYRPANNTLALVAGGQEAIRATGPNVGIAGALSTAGTITAAGGIGSLLPAGSDSSVSANISGVASVAVGFNATSSTNAFGAAQNFAYIGTAQGFPLGFQTSGQTKMTLTAAGSLLLGTTTAGAGYSGQPPKQEAYSTSFGAADPDSATIALYGNSNTAGAGGAMAFGSLYSTGNFATFARVRGAKENSTSGHYGGGLAFDVRQTGGGLLQAMTIESNGAVTNFVTGGSTPLAVNGQMRWNVVSDTVLRLLYRGSDGVTRSASLTLS